MPKQGGEHKEAVRALCEACGLAVQTVWNCANVCKNFLPGGRFPELTFKHHRVVAKYPPEDQRRWLQAALEGDGDGKRTEAAIAPARRLPGDRTRPGARVWLLGHVYIQNATERQIDALRGAGLEILRGG